MRKKEHQNTQIGKIVVEKNITKENSKKSNQQTKSSK
jgi:hypothetical protein